MTASLLRLARSTLVLCGVAGLGACNQTTVQPTRGNLDRVTDIVVVTAGDGHSYTVTANPDLEHLRIVDMTTGAFVRSPNRFFPLSPPSAATELALAVDVTTTANDATRVFGLNPTTDTVDIVHVIASDGDDEAFAVVGSWTTGRAPADVAALRLPSTTLVAVTVPAAGTVEVYSLSDAHASTLLTTVTLPDGAVPDRIVADPLGTAFVVGDAVRGALYMLEPAADGSDVVLERNLEVSGPIGALAAGIVDVGDGQAPVVLALHADSATATLVRLFRRDVPEDRYAVLAEAELPNVAVAGYVPDVRATAAPTTVCCVGLSTAQVASGEASAAWGGVLLADGRLLYMQLAASTIDGLALEAPRRALRLVDNDPGPPGAAMDADATSAAIALREANDATGDDDSDDEVIFIELDVNAGTNLWVPAEGGDDRRPVVSFAAVDNFGSPPLVPLLPEVTTLLLTWEGDLPVARAVPATLTEAVITTEVDLAARSVRVGDVARLTLVEPLDGCDADVRATIVGIDGPALTVATSDVPEDVALSSAAQACLSGAALRLTVEAREAFVAEDALSFWQRLAFGEALALPGRTLSLTPATAGVPLTGSKLSIPLSARTTTLGLDLVGNFDARALVPTAIAGGTLVIPDVNSDVDNATIAARRMVVSAGSVDARLAQSRLFTFDEAETVTTNIEPLQ